MVILTTTFIKIIIKLQKFKSDVFHFSCTLIQHTHSMQINRMPSTTLKALSTTSVSSSCCLQTPLSFDQAESPCYSCYCIFHVKHYKFPKPELAKAACDIESKKGQGAALYSQSPSCSGYD